MTDREGLSEERVRELRVLVGSLTLGPHASEWLVDRLLGWHRTAAREASEKLREENERLRSLHKTQAQNIDALLKNEESANARAEQAEARERERVKAAQAEVDRVTKASIENRERAEAALEKADAFLAAHDEYWISPSSTDYAVLHETALAYRRAREEGES